MAVIIRYAYSVERLANTTGDCCDGLVGCWRRTPNMGDELILARILDLPGGLL